MNVRPHRLSLLLSSAACTLLLAGLAPVPAQQPDIDPAAQQDAPSRVARIAVIEGAVSLEPSGVNQFSQAELNYPLTIGDRIYTDLAGFSALETGGVALRMANGADLTVSSLTDAVAQFGLAQGSVHVHTRVLTTSDGQQGLVEIDTPNGAILVEREGDLRVDSYPQDDTTIISVYSGQAEVTGPGFDQQLAPGQALRLSGANPTQVEGVQVPQQDALDGFDARQEQIFLSATDIRNNYVSDEMIGAADLDQYGQWQPDQDYGQVWYPTQVAVGWTPYTNGHWAWVAPWGWTWVESEPWGFAPFHYGRWNNFHGRWGWVPGPPPTVWGYRRPVRPIYSPALVAFVGGPGFSVAAGFSERPGAGVTAWFPLGPREAYVPWYHASPAYVNRVNVTNLYNRNQAEVRNTYVNRTTNVYNANVTNVTYVNRQIATTAVTQRDFAAGHSVARSEPVHLDANTRAQLNSAPILPHPMVTPAPSIAAPQAAARALPPNLARPVLETRTGLVRSGGAAGGVPPAFQRPVSPISQPGQIQGQVQAQRPADRNPVAPAPQQGQVQGRPQPSQPADRTPANPVVNTPRQYTPPPAQTPAPVRPTVPTQPVQQPHAGTAPYPQPARPIQPTQRAVASPSPVTQVAPAAQAPAANVRAPEQERPLLTRTQPQPAQPAFDVQRREIETHDPGRPLGPQQVQNLRSGRPAGPPSQPEPVQHPQPRPAPQPARSAPAPAPAQPQKPK